MRRFDRLLSILAQVVDEFVQFLTTRLGRRVQQKTFLELENCRRRLLCRLWARLRRASLGRRLLARGLAPSVRVSRLLPAPLHSLLLISARLWRSLHGSAKIRFARTIASTRRPVRRTRRRWSSTRQRWSDLRHGAVQVDALSLRRRRTMTALRALMRWPRSRSVAWTTIMLRAPRTAARHCDARRFKRAAPFSEVHIRLLVLRSCHLLVSEESSSS